jgi:hypothetical protein
MFTIIQNIPILNTYSLTYVLETMKLKHKPNTLWVEVGVANGNTINYISKFTQDKMYGFDAFEGMPGKWREYNDGFEKSALHTFKRVPPTNKNVELIKGRFNTTLLDFLQTQNKKVSFVHVDVGLYNDLKYVLGVLNAYMDTECVVVFDELVNNYVGEEDNQRLKAFYEFVIEYDIHYKWIGMYETPTVEGYQNVALVIHNE